MKTRPQVYVSLTVLLILCTGAWFVPATAQVQDAPILEKELLDVVVAKGDKVYPWTIYTSQAAYVAAFRINPYENRITLVYPNEFQREESVGSGFLNVLDAPRTSRLYTTERSFPESNLLNTTSRRTGNRHAEYLLVVASPEPFVHSPMGGTPAEFRDHFGVRSHDIDETRAYIESSLVDKKSTYYASSMISF